MTTAGARGPAGFAGLKRYPVSVVVRSALAKLTRSGRASCARADADRNAAAMATTAVTLRRKNGCRTGIVMAQYRLAMAFLDDSRSFQQGGSKQALESGLIVSSVTKSH